MSISGFIWTNPTLMTFMEKSPEDALAKSMIKFGKCREEKQAGPESFSMKREIPFTKKRDDRRDTIVLYKILKTIKHGKGKYKELFHTTDEKWGT